MKSEITTLILMFSTAACSAPDRLEMPSFPDPPTNWKTFSLSSIPGSNCPNIEGEYSEPPLIYRSGKKAKYTPTDKFDLYSSYIPFHLGERRELEANDLDLARDHFVIRQPDVTQFYFVYLNELTRSLVEYHFRSTEGDFECKNGYIEFPNYTTYGMIEGRSVNFQIRNVVVMDETGALVIQSTRGPYRGELSNAKKEFSFEFLRYSASDSANP